MRGMNPPHDIFDAVKRLFRKAKKAWRRFEYVKRWYVFMPDCPLTQAFWLRRIRRLKQTGAEVWVTTVPKQHMALLAPVAEQFVGYDLDPLWDEAEYQRHWDALCLRALADEAGPRSKETKPAASRPQCCKLIEWRRGGDLEAGPQEAEQLFSIRLPERRCGTGQFIACRFKHALHAIRAKLGMS